jgi:DNA polymerase epsilon subunit 1
MLLPDGFPEDVKINFKSGKVLKLSYPCHILNHLIYDKYANDQYQWLQDNK